MGDMAAGDHPEALVKFEDVIIYFSKGEWVMLEKWQKDLYLEVLADNYDTLVFTGHPVTKSDILAWLEECERLHAKGTQQPRASDSSGTLCATSGGVAQTCLKERVKQVRSLGKIQERAKEDAAQHGDVGETEHLDLSVGKQGNPLQESPFPHTEYKKDRQGVARSTHSQRTVTAPTQHTCGERSKRSRLKTLLQIHQKISARSESFPCPKCGVHFPSPSLQRTHLQACAERGKASLRENGLSLRHGNLALERLHHCAGCGGSFRRYLDLLQHQKSHDEAKPWPCPQCEDVLMYQSDLALHEERHLEDALPERAACGKNCICECSLLLHFASHRGQSMDGSNPGPQGHKQLLQAAYSKEEKPYSCARCGLPFKLEVNLEVHYRYCRKEWQLKQELNCTPQIPQKVHGEPTIDPSVCGGSRGSSWRPQQHPPQTSAPHACADCGKRFAFQFKLHKHQRKHKTGKHRDVARRSASGSFVGSSGGPKTATVTKKLHKCQECGLKFVYKWQLATHLKGHVKEERYHCSYCGENLGCRSSLREHHQRHRDEAAHRNGASPEDFGATAVNRRPCETKRLSLCECGRSFAKAYLHVHQAFHAGVRYKCLVCGKVCSFQSTAVAHSKRHRDKGDVPDCPKCKELPRSRPWCCMIERIHLEPSLQPHGQVGMAQPSKGFPPKYLDPERAERISPGTPLHFEPHVSAGEQSGQAAHRRKPRRKPNLRPTSRNSFPKPFKCRDCGRDFAYFGNLITHRRMHTGDYPVQCAECGKSFIHKHYLNLHWKVHAKESV